MSILSSLSISGSGLTAQRLRMDVIANNIANAESTQSADGTPYKRQEVVFMPVSSTSSLIARKGGSGHALGEGVRVAAILEDDSPPRVVYDPTHPHANPDGYVEYPDVDIITEMTDMISATRAYEANVTALKAAKAMAAKALEIARG